MGNINFAPDYDQHDPKEFKENLGSFGTTTMPGADQLKELITKINQGVKHVELHLNASDKGEFGKQDVPDKYGLAQRKTIMQLAKLNEQTLSVHASLSVVSFSGLENGSFNDYKRYKAIREIDETVKFAAETAKGGAVVVHVQGEPLTTDKSELTVPKSYVNWLKNKAENEKDKEKREYYKKEFENLQKYFKLNKLERPFVSDINKIDEIKSEFATLPESEKKKYVDEAKKRGQKPFDVYYNDVYLNKLKRKQKLSPDSNPLVVIGDKISQTARIEKVFNYDKLKEVLKGKGNEDVKKILERLDVKDVNNVYFLDLKRLEAIVTNDKTKFHEEFNITPEEDKKLKELFLVDYDKVLKKNYNLETQADEEFHRELMKSQLNSIDYKIKDLEAKYSKYRQYLNLLNDPEVEKFNELRREKSFNDIVKMLGEKKIDEINKKLEKAENLKKELEERDPLVFNDLARYDETITELYKNKRKLIEELEDISSVTEVIYNKNVNAVAQLGLKALNYQLDLKEKALGSKKKLKKVNDEIRELKKKIENAKDYKELKKYEAELDKKIKTHDELVKYTDYDDIDVIEKPLYIAPENMLPGYGSFVSLEEFKALLRLSQDSFAKKILSDEEEYKKIREEYEKRTGKKIKNYEDALKLAKNHIGGTFDSAHAAVWLNHFNKEPGESDEHWMERFNKWLNEEAEKMYKEGLIKHIHFNDSLGKDDDHNLIGEGFLDLEDLRKRLRGAGFKEALIVEAGGRGSNELLHLRSAFDLFNPTLSYEGASTSNFTGMTDWINVKRNYELRKEYSNYGLSYSTFKHVKPKDYNIMGSWSQTGFL